VISFKDSTVIGVGTDDYAGGGEPCALSFTQSTVIDANLNFAHGGPGCSLFARNTAFSWTKPGGQLAFTGGTIEHSSFTGNASAPGFEISPLPDNSTAPSLSITDSVFTGNLIGIKLRGNKLTGAKIQQCNLAGNQQWTVEDHTTHVVDATNNWWGTTDTQQIDQAIYDGSEDVNADYVNYLPVLSAANPNAGLE
jgi:hypothetical protein